MLHMLLAIHGPDTCAAAVPAIREIAMEGFQKMDEVTKALGITVQGSWANMPAHVPYLVVDAPNAHVVNQLARESRLMEWNTVTVTPVLTLNEAIGIATE